MSTIWAFDLGKGSIGEAVWDEGEKRFNSEGAPKSAPWQCETAV